MKFVKLAKNSQLTVLNVKMLSITYSKENVAQPVPLEHLPKNPIQLNHVKFATDLVKLALKLINAHHVDQDLSWDLLAYVRKSLVMTHKSFIKVNVLTPVQKKPSETQLLIPANNVCKTAINVMDHLFVKSVKTDYFQFIKEKNV